MRKGQLTKVEPTPEAILAEHLDSWEAHVSAWIQRRDEAAKNQFVMGLIASSVATAYGEKSIVQFANEVGEAASTVYLYRDVYRKCFEFSKRLENLNWLHFVVIVRAALEEADCEALLIAAADGGWSARQLKREVSIRAVRKALSAKIPQLDPQMASAISHWREVRQVVEKFSAVNPQFSLYGEDYIGDVQEGIDDPWGSAQDFIERLIHTGCREVEALVQASHWTKETVELLCEELVALGSHEWRKQGGQTEEARGASRKLISPVTEPFPDE